MKNILKLVEKLQSKGSMSLMIHDVTVRDIHKYTKEGAVKSNKRDHDDSYYLSAHSEVDGVDITFFTSDIKEKL